MSNQISCSVVSDSLRPHESQHARPPCPSPTPGVHRLMSIKSVMPSSHLILCCPLLFLPSIFPNIRVFPNESDLRIRWPKYWSFSFNIIPTISSVQSLSRVWLFETPWIAARQASLSIANSQSLLKLMSIELVMPSSHLILYSPLLLLPSIFPNIRVFSDESVLRINWPKYWSFSSSITPSNEYSGLISLRMDWLDLAVQGTLKSLLQHHSSKASILHHSAFFIFQLTSIHDY